MKKYILLAITLLIICSLSANTVSGYVYLNGGSGVITSVQVKFNPQSNGTNNVYLNPDETGFYSYEFSSDEFDTYDVTFKLYSSNGDYYLVPINNVLIDNTTTPLTLDDVTLQPITNSTNVVVSNNESIPAFRYIQDAVDYLSIRNSGTVTVLPGTYTGNRNKNINWSPTGANFNERHIKVIGVGECIIDCEGSGYAFWFEAPWWSNYQYTIDDVAENLIIKKAYRGIVITNGSPLIRNNIVENCSIPGFHELHGAGIYCGSSAIIVGNTIRNNVANWTDWEDSKSLGGGIYIENSDFNNAAKIINNIISGNSAYNGGGIYCTGSGRIDLSGNTITENTLVEGSGNFPYPDDHGTGIYCQFVDDITIKDNLIYGNIPYPGSYGISLFIDCTDALIYNNTIIDNIAHYGIKIKASSSAIIENNVISNNRYGIHRFNGGIPLTATYCCISNNTSGNYIGVTSGTGCLAENVDPNLDQQTYQPLWISDAKSPCINVGDPALPLDPDGTPSDIGAIRAINHTIDTVELFDANEGINWKCFPVLDDIYAEEDIAANVLYDIMSPPIPAALELVETQGGVNDIYFDTYWHHDDQQFTSVKGYKLEMNEAATLEITGFLEYPEQIINLVAGGENWTGYFLEESMNPFDALAEVLDKINRITTRTFTYIKLADNSWLGIGNIPRVPTLNYGDLVIVNCTENGSFFWGEGGAGTVPIETRSSSQDFTYTEEADYIPVYVELDLEALDNPTEIGIFVENECKGAEVIEDTLVQIRAYVFNDSLILDPGSVEFQLSYGSRAENVLIDSYTIKENLDDAGRMGKLDFTQTQNSYYLISLNEDDNNVPEVAKTSLNQNYPNPFNPSTTIAYSILNDGMIELKVYNIKGQLVKTLVMGEQQTGSYEVVWNGKDNNEKNISSGVYFYKLSTKDKTIMKKMLILK
ncbi:MAG: right-handed parallel beta-helix repeat-containing protein [Candidatus Tenebribacter burtonii]|nr:right-handed parallel beta-helix repeat-containing protein [Candidatus Tenebribacter burtonii]